MKKAYIFLLAIFFCYPLFSLEPVILLLGPPGSGKEEVLKRFS